MKVGIRKKESGIYVVEYALVSGVFFLMLFGVIEVSRLLYTWSALDAITQRGARVAAVCPLNNAAIAQTAIFANAGSTTIVPGLTTANISVQYLDQNGGAAASRGNTRYVVVSIQNYTHQMLIPQTVAGFLAPLLTAPSFSTIRPAESLGIHPGGTDYC